MPPKVATTPRIAVSSGIPAASSEPNVMSSTTPANSTPNASVIVRPNPGLLEHLAAERDLESGVAAGFARCEHGVDRLVGDLRDGSVELDLDVRGALVAGDLVARVLVERPSTLLRDAVDVLEPWTPSPRSRRGRAPPRRTRRRAPRPRPWPTPRPSAGTPRRAGRDRVLRLGAGDGVGLLELPAEADAEAEQGAERHGPGDDDEPGAAEGGASDAVEEEGHGFSLVSGGGAGVRSGAGGAADSGEELADDVQQRDAQLRVGRPELLVGEGAPCGEQERGAAERDAEADLVGHALAFVA